MVTVRFLLRLHRRLNLVWKIFFANLAMILVLVGGLLILDRRMGSSTAGLTLLLLAAVVAMLDYALLRMAASPLIILSAVVAAINPKSPTAQLPLNAADPDVRATAQLLNRLLLSLAAERRQSARRLIAAQEEERRALAQRIHDSAVQSLALQQIVLDRTAPGALTPAIGSSLAEVRRLGQDSLNELRLVIQDMRPPALDQLGLVAAISSLLEGRARPLGIKSLLRVSGQPVALAPELETSLYRTVSEAVVNAIRHSGCRAITVRLRFGRGWLFVFCTDDGRGFAAGAAATGYGIPGMLERTALFGGQLEIGPAAAGGTRVRLAVPLSETPTGGVAG
ncbi:MAG: sensor histidine kinase [Sulfobacillus sp.]